MKPAGLDSNCKIVYQMYHLIMTLSKMRPAHIGLKNAVAVVADRLQLPVKSAEPILPFF